MVPTDLTGSGSGWIMHLKSIKSITPGFEMDLEWPTKIITRMDYRFLWILRKSMDYGFRILKNMDYGMDMDSVSNPSGPTAYRLCCSTVDSGYKNT